MKKIIFLIGLLFISLLTLNGCRGGQISIPNQSLNPQDGPYVAGQNLEIEIITPNPYPVSEEGTQLVWEYNLKDSDALDLRLHFEYFDVNGLFLKTGETIEYPPCETQDTNAEYDEQGNLVAIGSVVDYGDCGIVFERYTIEKILENNYLEGDYVLLRNNKNGEVLSILTNGKEFYKNGAGRPVRVEGWSYIYGTNDLNIELYSNENENKGSGFYINKYAQLNIGLGIE